MSGVKTPEKVSWIHQIDPQASLDSNADLIKVAKMFDWRQDKPYHDPLWVVSFPWDRVANFSKIVLEELYSLRISYVVATKEPVKREDQLPSFQLFGRYIEALRRGERLQRFDLARLSQLDPIAVALLETGNLSSLELTDNVVDLLAKGLKISRDSLRLDPFRS